jgi:NAD(P)-dependent dehydrogenase (short-subunit alcohol dehydrogenase family)
MTDEGKVVVITGAAGGIGRAAVERFARAGWRVVATDRDAAKLAWLDGVAGVIGLAADVTSAADNAEIIALAEKTFGGVDAIILNAAIPLGGGIEDVSMEALHGAMAVNFYGPVLGIKAALPALRRRGGGAIVVTSSMHGLVGETANWAYAATKHAVVGMVRSLSRDHGWENIRINAICPGLTRQTGMTEDIEAHGPDSYRGLAGTVPLQRWAEPDEMAAVMEFLVSPAASYINGLALPVDGGTGTGSGMLPPLAGR